MSDDRKPGSFLPDDHTEGGFFDDKDASITKAVVCAFDYQGKREAVCALGITFRPDDAEDDDDDRTEYYRIGNMDQFVPSGDGKFYLPVGSKSAMNKNTKASLFLRALKEKGFEMSKLADGINALEGLHVHVNIVPMPSYAKEGEEKKENKILVITKIHDTPAPNAKSATKGGGAKRKADQAKTDAGQTTTTASTGAGAATAGVDPEVEGRTIEVILTVLSEKGGKVAKSAIPPALFQKIPNTEAALRNKCVALASNAAWISSGDRPWQYDGGELKTLG